MIDEQAGPVGDAVPASTPRAHTLMISREEYDRRRDVEVKEAVRSVAVFGSWAAYAQSLLHGLVTFERDAGRQWGSFHHQCAIAAAGLEREIARGIEARSVATAGPQDESPVHKDAPEGGPHE